MKREKQLVPGLSIPWFYLKAADCISDENKSFPRDFRINSKEAKRMRRKLVELRLIKLNRAGRRGKMNGVGKRG